jgi:hypothetical protein
MHTVGKPLRNGRTACFRDRTKARQFCRAQPRENGMVIETCQLSSIEVYVSNGPLYILIQAQPQHYSSSLCSSSSSTPTIPAPLDPSGRSLRALPASLNLEPNTVLADWLAPMSQICTLAAEPAAARVRGESGEKPRVKTLPCSHRNTTQ